MSCGAIPLNGWTIPRVLQVLLACAAAVAVLAPLAFSRPAALPAESSGTAPGDRISAPDTAAVAIDDGPGGPILILASAANPFTRYYAEILRAEGLNAFSVIEVSQVDAIVLSQHDVILLGEMPLTPAQATLLADWVATGGNLIAMRPDKTLAPLLGLADAGSTLANAYLRVDTTRPPGSGIVGETMQFHGIADRYALNGAVAVATLYTDASTPTTGPAVTLHAVGPGGGQAAAFTYDLARSVVYTRQGNPVWAGQERDGFGPIRSDDLFYGPASFDPQPDWIDLNKVHIPQADEQQRLLTNLILTMNLGRKPLPRFWYFPRGKKAVVVMTGDDHASGGTAGRFDAYKAASPAGCSVARWECVRSSSYIYPNSPLTQAEAFAYQADGFEVGVHVDTGCADWTPETLDAFYASQLAAWSAKYLGILPPASERTHCIAWSDYATQPKVERIHGIRLDANYYYWPPSWVSNRPGFFTGSGLPMRFADADGTLIDVHQATTQMTDESGQSYPFTIDTLLDRALGPEGYYGVFTANMHTDSAASAGSDAIVASARVRGIPIVSGRQMVEWLDGRDGSSFGSLAWSGDTLSFTIRTALGANGLQAMLPSISPVGVLTEIRLDGAPVAFTLQRIKGIDYGVFDVGDGSYGVIYAVDRTGPVISNLAALPEPGGVSAAITWTTDESSDSRVDYGTDPAALASHAGDSTLGTGHRLTLTGLAPSTTYYFRVTSTDAFGNATVAPPPAEPPASFTTPLASFVDTTAVDFSAGLVGPDTYIAQTGDGEVTLAPAVGAEFSGTSLPEGWSVNPWPSGCPGTGTVAQGVLSLNGARAGTDALYPPGRSLEFVATFSGAQNQHIGFGQTLNEVGWAIFSTLSGGPLYARTSSTTGASREDLIPGDWLNAPHRFRIDWAHDAVVYSVDGVPKMTHAIAIGGDLRPLASDLCAADSGLSLDWLRMSPYTATATFLSRVFDAGQPTAWGPVTWTASLPPGTGLTLSTRSGDTPFPDSTWSAFAPLDGQGASITGVARYLQYRTDLVTTDPARTPDLSEVAISYQAGPDATPPTIVSRSPTPGAIDVPVGTVVTITFNEPMDPATITGSTLRLRAPCGAIEVPGSVSVSGSLALFDPAGPLAPGTLYEVLLAGSVSDASGNPLGSPVSWTFTTAPVSLHTLTTAADFSSGTTTGTYVAETPDGEVILAPAAGAEFSGSALPAGWSLVPWDQGCPGGATLGDGSLSLNGARVATDAFYAPGRSLEFAATFTGAPSQHIGLGQTLREFGWALFSTRASGGPLYARTSTSTGAQQESLISGDWLNAPHLFRIDWQPDAVVYSIDGVRRASHLLAIGVSLRPIASDLCASDSAVIVDWMRLGPYAPLGSFESTPFDSGCLADWLEAASDAILPAGTSLLLETRSGDTPLPDSVWSPWEAVAGRTIASPTRRYVQVRALLSTNDPSTTPVLRSMTLSFADQCVPGTPEPEVCDGLDNDCDGTADDGYQDTDSDGDADCVDSDDDNDLVPDPADCAPLVGSVNAVPGEVGPTLRASSDTASGSFAWIPVAQANVHNVYRGIRDRLSGAWSDTLACLIAESPAANFANASSPPSGSAFFYLVTGVNRCGEGSAGLSSAGAARILPGPCPALGLDSDSDGVLDLDDDCPLRADGTQLDGDHDGRGDACDNCPNSSNPGQEDTDADGTGNSCQDADADGFPVSQDCDDLNPAVNPASVEVCNGLDDDCDGVTDENALRATCAPTPATVDLDAADTVLSLACVFASACDPGTPLALPPAALDPVPLYLSSLDDPTATGPRHLFQDPLSLPCPDTSGSTVFERGVAETLSDRAIASDTAVLRFSDPTDGDCRTLDGNLQDVRALLSDVPDGSVVLLCFSGRFAGSPLEACASLQVRNRGSR